ncbi:unnamed protein product [Orchesella dallaii]|uniref:Uncharacterized protein n=1 Tax=Orchesella dallaii TaxID=48710 RepID=A0ABP1S1K2_9HEXA
MWKQTFGFIFFGLLLVVPDAYSLEWKVLWRNSDKVVHNSWMKTYEIDYQLIPPCENTYSIYPESVRDYKIRECLHTYYNLTVIPELKNACFTSKSKRSITSAQVIRLSPIPQSIVSELLGFASQVEDESSEEAAKLRQLVFSNYPEEEQNPFNASATIGSSINKVENETYKLIIAEEFLKVFDNVANSPKRKARQIEYSSKYLTGNNTQAFNPKWLERFNIRIPCLPNCSAKFVQTTKCTINPASSNVKLNFRVPKINTDYEVLEVVPFVLLVRQGYQTCRGIYDGPQNLVYSKSRKCIVYAGIMKIDRYFRLQPNLPCNKDFIDYKNKLFSFDVNNCTTTVSNDFKEFADVRAFNNVQFVYCPYSSIRVFNTVSICSTEYMSYPAETAITINGIDFFENTEVIHLNQTLPGDMKKSTTSSN